MLMPSGCICVGTNRLGGRTVDTSLEWLFCLPADDGGNWCDDVKVVTKMFYCPSCSWEADQPKAFWSGIGY